LPRANLGHRGEDNLCGVTWRPLRPLVALVALVAFVALGAGFALYALIALRTLRSLLAWVALIPLLALAERDRGGPAGGGHAEVQVAVFNIDVAEADRLTLPGVATGSIPLRRDGDGLAAVTLVALRPLDALVALVTFRSSVAGVSLGAGF